MAGPLLSEVTPGGPRCPITIGPAVIYLSRPPVQDRVITRNTSGGISGGSYRAVSVAAVRWVSAPFVPKRPWRPAILPLCSALLSGDGGPAGWKAQYARLEAAMTRPHLLATAVVRQSPPPPLSRRSKRGGGATQSDSLHHCLAGNGFIVAGSIQGQMITD